MGAASELLERVPLSIDVDHHHDNTRFGTINLVLDHASSTGEIVAGILDELGVELTREIAEPIYVALMTDTGRFGYTNTTPEAHDLAARLLRAGVDPRRVFQEVYERVALAHLKLVGRAEERAAVYEGGRLIVSYLVRSDFADFGVGEEYAEGIIDRLRSVDGTEMAAMIREPPEPPNSPRRVSLRASHDEIDVSAIARKRGGGGHRQAAGFSSEESIEKIVEFVRSEFVQATRAATRA
jgi:phosphoesterase RecJ-like protein